MSKIQVDAIEQQSGTTLTTGGGASKTVVVDATTVTLGRCGGTVALASGATQSGFGRTGTVDWQTSIKTSTFTAVNGEGYFVNTSGGAVTVNLPAGSAGAIISIKDYAQSFDNNTCTIAANGSEKIDGLENALLLTTEGIAVTLVYGDATKGWQPVNSNEIKNQELFLVATGGTITENGNDKIHTFTGPGTFTVTQAASCSANNAAAYMIIAGGGGGGVDRGGGGGAGGFREARTAPITPYTASPLVAPAGVTVSAQAYPIVIGSGGAGGTAPGPSAPSGVSGSPSSGLGVISAGGGGGKNSNTGSAFSGGSGGGTSGSSPGGRASGNTPPVSPPQGNPGGIGQDGSPFATGAGGGGAGAAAADGSSPSGVSPAGGAGISTSITGAAVTRAGGGGATGKNPAAASAGGSGGGGVAETGSNGAAGTVNTGSGGGASCTANAGAGGSGIVIIRYKFQ